MDLVLVLHTITMLYHHFSRVSLYVCFIGMDGSVLVVIVYTGIASVNSEERHREE